MASHMATSNNTACERVAVAVAVAHPTTRPRRGAVATGSRRARAPPPAFAAHLSSSPSRSSPQTCCCSRIAVAAGPTATARRPAANDTKGGGGVERGAPPLRSPGTVYAQAPLPVKLKLIK